jgi:mono/diheme cytochrome c family protein
MTSHIQFSNGAQAMPQAIRCSLITILIILTPSFSPASAACRTKTVAKSSDEIEVVVPFAVPVGVPVAPFAPYFYSYQQTLAAPQTGYYQGRIGASGPMTPDDKTPPPDVTPPIPQSPSSYPQASSVPPPPSSHVAMHCAACHGGQTPKAGLSLEHPETLNITDRLNAVHAVVTGRMPKGSRLSAEELQAVLAELATVPPQKIESSSSHPLSTQSDR